MRHADGAARCASRRLARVVPSDANHVAIATTTVLVHESAGRAFAGILSRHDPPLDGHLRWAQVAIGCPGLGEGLLGTIAALHIGILVHCMH